MIQGLHPQGKKAPAVGQTCFPWLLSAGILLQVPQGTRGQDLKTMAQKEIIPLVHAFVKSINNVLHTVL